jgi:hypothetical protein
MQHNGLCNPAPLALAPLHDRAQLRRCTHWRLHMEGTIREARLRPQYASLYPALEAGTWQPASAIGRQLLLWHLTAPSLPDGERLMSEEHFEFRGGSRRDSAEANVRTRHADRSTA